MAARLQAATAFSMGPRQYKPCWTLEIIAIAFTNYFSWTRKFKHILALLFNTHSAVPSERRIASITSPRWLGSFRYAAIIRYTARVKRQIQNGQLQCIESYASNIFQRTFQWLPSHIVDLFHWQDLQLTGCQAASEVTSAPVTCTACWLLMNSKMSDVPKG